MSDEEDEQAAEIRSASEAAYAWDDVERGWFALGWKAGQAALSPAPTDGLREALEAIYQECEWVDDDYCAPTLPTIRNLARAALAATQAPT